MSALAEALHAACALGVTRLADVTGLDRIGLPVWQAVRPWGRSLSVHQGKGLTADAARLGACMEAIECSHAEAWTAPTITAAWADLPPGERAAAADDFATERGAISAETCLEWTPAERLAGGVLWVPEAAVSLDLTRLGPDGVARSSNGQGAGFDLAFATAKALGEVIERDAFAHWQVGSVYSRRDDEIDLGTIDFPWFTALHGCCQSLGISVRAYGLPAVIAMPVVAVELHDASGEAVSHSHAAGTCAHPDAELALRGALMEAIQARLTVIAGAREDLGLDHPVARAPVFGFAIAHSSGRPHNMATAIAPFATR